MRGTGQGERGPDADKGSYDSLAYWNRAGIALGVQAPRTRSCRRRPRPAFGDSIGAMTIAGGIMGALFHRERTGRGHHGRRVAARHGIWSMGAAMALSLQHGVPWRPPPAARTAAGQPARRRTTDTKDDRFVAFVLLAGRRSTGPRLCEVIGRPELATTSASPTPRRIMARTPQSAKELVAEIVRRTHVGRVAGRGSSDFSGQWTVVQDTLEAAADPQAVANGYVPDCTTSDGTAFKLATRRSSSTRSRAEPKRAPEMNEHGDAILSDLGIDWDTIVDLKVRGIVA